MKLAGFATKRETSLLAFTFKEAAIPWRRAGTAGEVADLVVFLRSDNADYITGMTVPIDGGLSLVDAEGA